MVPCCLLPSSIFSSGFPLKTFSAKESELLYLPIEQKGAILLKSLSLNRILGDVNYFTTRSMDVYIAKLRKFPAADPGLRIVTLHGSGYHLIEVFHQYSESPKMDSMTQ